MSTRTRKSFRVTISTGVGLIVLMFWLTRFLADSKQPQTSPIASGGGEPGLVTAKPRLKGSSESTISERRELEKAIPSESAPSVPKGYTLPKFEVGMSTGDFLADYWGGEWPQVEGYYTNSMMASNLENINTKDWAIGLPMGTIEDFFEGLEARAISNFMSVWSDPVYAVHGTRLGAFSNSNALISEIVKSPHFNPHSKDFSSMDRASLSALVEERSALPRALATDILERMKQLIHEDIVEITSYREPIHGRSFISPLISGPYGTQPSVSRTEPYPVFDISLPARPRQGAATAGGFFSGWLTIWAGSDSRLAYLYGELASQSSTFDTSVVGFIDNL